MLFICVMREAEVQWHDVKILDSTPVNQWEQEPHVVLGWCEVVQDVQPIDHVEGVVQETVSLMWVVCNDLGEVMLVPHDEKRMVGFEPDDFTRVDLGALVAVMGRENFSKSGLRFGGRAQTRVHRNVYSGDDEKAPIWLLSVEKREIARGAEPRFEWEDKNVEVKWRQRGALVGKLTIDPVTGQKVFVKE